MCVIIHKMVGGELHASELTEAWNTNSHGAGYMYRDGTDVVIQKGFMELAPLLAALKADGFLVNDTLVADREIALHFRIATSGGIAPGRTHPFPIHRSYKVQERLEYSTKAALMHNGVIGSLGGTDYSDTQEITSTVFHHVFRDGMSANELKKAIEDAYPTISFYSSKFLIFTPKSVYWLGSFTEEKGVKFSNTNHRNTYASASFITCNPYYPLQTTQYDSTDPFPSATNAILNSFRRVWKRMGGEFDKVASTLLPHLKLLDACMESTNCLTCEFFRFRKQVALCKVWRAYKTEAAQYRPELTEFLGVLHSTLEVTDNADGTAQVLESM